MREILLLSFLGPDQPNQFTRVMQALSVHSLQIVDIKQHIHNNQCELRVALHLDLQSSATALMHSLNEMAQSLGLSMTRIAPSDQQDQPIALQSDTSYRVTILAPQIHSAHLVAVAQMLDTHGFTIHHLCDYTSQYSASTDAFACVKLAVDTKNYHHDTVQQACLALSAEQHIDVILQDHNVTAQDYGLICFDMDSTLIQQEVIDELAIEAGIGAQVAEITERAMQGELDFQQSFRARVALLKGLDEAVLPHIATRLVINPGAHELISTLKSLGYKTAILSGGFHYFATYIQQQLGIDEVHTNALDTKAGQVTGEVHCTIVDAERKAILVQELAEKYGLSTQQVITVGDGANDIPMLALAGLGVAYHAKPRVRQHANYAISTVGLNGILPLLGLTPIVATASSH